MSHLLIADVHLLIENKGQCLYTGNGLRLLIFGDKQDKFYLWIEKWHFFLND